MFPDPLNRRLAVASAIPAAEAKRRIRSPMSASACIMVHKGDVMEIGQAPSTRLRRIVSDALSEEIMTDKAKTPPPPPPPPPPPETVELGKDAGRTTTISVP